MTLKHSDVPAGFIHTPFNWIYANATDRLADGDFLAGDVNKIAIDLDTANVWVVSAVDGGGAPTWTTVSGVGLAVADGRYIHQDGTGMPAFVATTTQLAQYVEPLFPRLMATLKLGVRNQTLVVQTDSTGRDDTASPTPRTGWVQRMASYLGTLFPAYTVNYYTFIDGSPGSWSSATLLQTGTAGGSAPVLSIYGAAIGGKNANYFRGAARQGLTVTSLQPDAIIISFGHNSGTDTVQWSWDYSALIESDLANAPGCELGLIAQNPEVAPATSVTQQQIRAYDVMRIGKLKGAPVVNVCQAFIDTGVPSAFINSGEGIHPSGGANGGQALWASIVQQALVAGLYTRSGLPSRPGLHHAAANLLSNGALQISGGVYETVKLHLVSGASGSTILTFTWNGVVYTTASVNFGDTAAQVASKLNAATGSGAPIPAGAFVGGGGPFGTTDVSVQCQGALVGALTPLTNTDTTLVSTFTESVVGVAPTCPGMTLNNISASQDIVNFERSAQGYAAKFTAKGSTGFGAYASWSLDQDQVAGRWVTAMARVYVPAGQADDLSICRFGIDDGTGVPATTYLSGNVGARDGGFSTIVTSYFVSAAASNPVLKLFVDSATGAGLPGANITVQEISAVLGQEPRGILPPSAIAVPPMSPISLTANSPSETPLTLRAAPSQTADVFDSYDGTGSKKFSISPTGVPDAHSGMTFEGTGLWLVASGGATWVVGRTGDTSTLGRAYMTSDGRIVWNTDGAAGTADFNLQRASTGYLTTSGNFGCASVGKGLRVAEGTLAKQGAAALTAGSSGVISAGVTANSRIFCFPQETGILKGTLRVASRSVGSGFTVESRDNTGTIITSDTVTFAWEIFEPG